MHRTRFIPAALAGSALLAFGPSRRGTAIRPLDHAVRVLPAQRGHESTRWIALTLAGNGGLGFRASGHLALENSKRPGLERPERCCSGAPTSDALLHARVAWRVDAVRLRGRRHVGVRQRRVQRLSKQLEYGAGVRHFRWAALSMCSARPGGACFSRFVLPTANLAPSPTERISRRTLVRYSADRRRRAVATRDVRAIAGSM